MQQQNQCIECGNHDYRFAKTDDYGPTFITSGNVSSLFILCKKGKVKNKNKRMMMIKI